MNDSPTALGQRAARSRPAGSAAPSSVVSQAMAGLVVAMSTMSSVLSATALLFSAAPANVQAHGLFLMLLSCILLGAVGAVFSTVPSSFISQDGASTAAIAAVTGPLAVGLTGAGPGVLTATLLATVSGITVLTGLALLGLGWARGGGVVRFLPLQVMAGLLSAIGWSLVVGGASVAVGHRLPLAQYLRPDVLPHVLLAAGWGLLMVAFSRRLRSPLVIPAMVVAGIGLHHAVFAALGIGVAAQHAAGWLLSAPDQLAPAFPWSLPMLGQVDWTALGREMPAIGAALAVNCLLVLINVSGLELALRQDVDFDRELRGNGAAALVAGLAGGSLGTLSIARTQTLYRFGVRNRVVPAAAAALAGLLPMAAPSWVGLVPRSVLGALLMLLGYNLLETWLVRVRQGLSRAEWLTVPVVVAVTVALGLPAAVFAGLAMGCATFAVMYSRTSPIRARCGGDIAQSNVDRSDAERAALLAQADAVLVLYLQGFVFFGTASRLLAAVKAELAGSAGRLRHLVLDCSNIDGLDGSARATLERLHQVAAAHGVALTYAALPPAASARLGALLRPGPGVDVAPTLDAALERIEQGLLTGRAPPRDSPRQFLDDLDPADAAALESALVRVSVPAGEALMVQDEASDHLVFLISGQADVFASFNGAAPVRVRQYGPGTMIGEIGFLLGRPRTATVRAITACEAWTLTNTAMRRLETTRPGAVLALQRAVMARLSRRLLDKDELIAALARGSR